ncbi:Protein HEXIM, partial [Stegodyphus mimosarum]
MTKVDVMLPQEKLKCSVSEDSPEPMVAQLVNPGKLSGSGLLSGKNKKVVNANFNSKLETNKLVENNSEHHSEVRKRKNKNRKRRKWKPYSKLTWDERRQLEERDSRRANRMREEMSAFGLTLAPYNTTQFLMEDHNLQEPDYAHIPNGHRHRENSNSFDSSDEFYSSPEDEEEFLQQQFVETYEDIHIEHLNNMSNSELVQELISMEDKVEMLEKSLQEAKLKKKSKEADVRPCDLNVEAELEKIRVFREEIEKLAQENDRLWRENEKLRRRLPRKA